MVEPSLDNLLDETTAKLEAMLGGLCGRLRPFPAFLGMTTIQAVELEPALNPRADRGCVVVTPDGLIAELDVTAIPGVVGVLEVDQVEEFKPLEDRIGGGVPDLPGRGGPYAVRGSSAPRGLGTGEVDVAGLAAGFAEQADPVDLHGAVHGLAHIVDREGRDADRR